MEEDNKHQLLFELNKIKEKHDLIIDESIELDYEIEEKTNILKSKLKEIEDLEAKYVEIMKKLKFDGI